MSAQARLPSGPLRGFGPMDRGRGSVNLVHCHRNYGLGLAAALRVVAERESAV